MAGKHAQQSNYGEQLRQLYDVTKLQIGEVALGATFITLAVTDAYQNKAIDATLGLVGDALLWHGTRRAIEAVNNHSPVEG